MRPAWPSRLLAIASLRSQGFRRFCQAPSKWVSETSAQNTEPDPSNRTAPGSPHKQARPKVENNRAIIPWHDIYALHPSSPGSPIFHPVGTHILQKLQAFLRAQYPSHGFKEVISPIIYKKSLWDISGHWDNYKDDMFAVTGRGAQGGFAPERQIGEEEEYGLKPMNCPGHCLLFKSQRRSYKDLPIRYADFSPLHRNELSGTLTGLTRLRRFHQDDGHIFCHHTQIEQEVRRTLTFVDRVYEIFGLGDYKFRLGTKPEHYIGNLQDWDRAESRLRGALEESRREYTIEPGGGAFYGPKIDIILTDADGKDHQTATIQLDFQLPAQFELEFDAPEKSILPGSDSEKTGTVRMQPQRPVLIHRAIFGSLERFMSLLAESYKGRWPFWMSPRQLTILTVGRGEAIDSRTKDIARQLASPDYRPAEAQALHSRHFMVDYDSSDRSLAKKIVDARKKGYSFYAIFGGRDLEKPLEKQTLNITLCSHPKPQVVQKVIGDVSQSQQTAFSNETKNGTSNGGDIGAALSVRQCQELLSRLDAQFL
ncbi:MAG: hypothetical protein L6R37_003014 [Teloschistes peruensis]|nr:MAG: hypothetical protein L6R37_003014 [Teloschistes peruensis]